MMERDGPKDRRQALWVSILISTAAGIGVAVIAALAKLPMVISFLLAGVAGGTVAGVRSQLATRPGEDEAARRKRMRSLAIALALAAMVILFYAATIVRLGGQAMNRPM